MQPHDELPDDTSRTEDGAVSTSFHPGTGRAVKIGGTIMVARKTAKTLFRPGQRSRENA